MPDRELLRRLFVAATELSETAQEAAIAGQSSALAARDYADAAQRLLAAARGNAADQECGQWLNNRAENSHQPFRRREGAMAKFRDVKTLQKFAAVHASIHNHFNHDRHLNRRDIFKQNRAAALAEWCGLMA